MWLCKWWGFKEGLKRKGDIVLLVLLLERNYCSSNEDYGFEGERMEVGRLVRYEYEEYEVMSFLWK